MRCNQIRRERLTFRVPYSDKYEVFSPCICVVTYHGESGFRSQQLTIAEFCCDICPWNLNVGSTDRQKTLSEVLGGNYSPLLDDITLCWYVLNISKTALKSNIAIIAIRRTQNIYLSNWNKYKVKGEKYTRISFITLLHD